MPEVVIQRPTAKLSLQEKLLKAIEGEHELIDHHERRLREARQRLREYRAELAKISGT